MSKWALYKHRHCFHPIFFASLYSPLSHLRLSLVSPISPYHILNLPSFLLCPIPRAPFVPIPHPITSRIYPTFILPLSILPGLSSPSTPSFCQFHHRFPSSLAKSITGPVLSPSPVSLSWPVLPLLPSPLQFPPPRLPCFPFLYLPRSIYTRLIYRVIKYSRISSFLNLCYFWYTDHTTYRIFLLQIWTYIFLSLLKCLCICVSLVMRCSHSKRICVIILHVFRHIFCRLWRIL